MTRVSIRLNGEEKTFDGPLSLAALLGRLSLPKEKVVVELNLEIVPRTDLEARALKDGDEVEIVHFVGGGSEPKARGPAGGGALVIVESPAKCKTIHKYLGAGYEVAASMGHVVDLPKSRMGIDVEHGFEPQYIVVKEKKKTLADLKAKAKNKREIILACDPDREGEAISWHLKNALGDGKKVSRVVFHEITKDAVQEAFRHPTEINMDLVGAQQARRVLDRIVGYSLSPLLWQKVGRGLSAGRVQSVALRLVVDRERQILAFSTEEYWTIEADLKKQKGQSKTFVAKLEKVKDQKARIPDRETAEGYLEKIKGRPFVVRDVREQRKKKNPSSPFTTSKLQQAAYNLLRFPASKTMRTAQTLYEGVEIGEEGSIGLITYMRTDSVRISDGAVAEIRKLILGDFGKAYLPATPPVYRSKKRAQEAHEAIRPTSAFRRPEDIEKYLTPDQFKLYRLIWRQAVSSQMTPAVIRQETVEIAVGRRSADAAAAEDYLFKATGSQVEFAGCLVLQGRSEEEDNPLPKLKAEETLDLVKIEKHQHFTKPPARYTDASLIKALEENGIGRPSTYAPILMTLTGRDYVRREGGSLAPTELGMLVTDLLVKHFEKIMDFKFTANMEEALDRVEEGAIEWVAVVKEFYGIFDGQVALARTGMQAVKKENEPTDEVCEKCGKPMVIKWGRRGRFMSCSGWPECKNAKSISTGIACPQCREGKLVARRAKSGKGRPFYGCTRYPNCNFITNKLPSAAPSSEDGPATEPSSDASETEPTA
ncbi:MAG: type I DNA topoisomerase [Candidatus Omnitrophica bacterium]|nr:type I DNA topoisomerase [Candidatus Omnitrophota bacterium]